VCGVGVGTKDTRSGMWGILEISGIVRYLLIAATCVLVFACSSKEDLPTASLVASGEPPHYLIGPGDSLTIFVWRNAELSTGVVVRPDGRISVPLIEDLYVSGKPSSDVAREIEQELAKYIQDPFVTVIVGGFVGPFSQQVRVVGEAAQPQAIPYRADMTMLDVMIAVGGLTEFADGNDATIVRLVDGEQKEYRARIDDLIKDGDISANVALLPGDVIIIPESLF